MTGQAGYSLERKAVSEKDDDASSITTQQNNKLRDFYYLYCTSF